MLVQVTPTMRSERTPPVETAGKPLVHVVDDEPSIQTLFATIGRLGGFEIASYGSAGDFLAKHEEARPGCLVLDLVLPDQTGIDLLQDLRSKGFPLPVIFMSGMARVCEAVLALKLGSVDFVEKPFDLENMLGTLRRAIQMDVERRREDLDREHLSERFATLSGRENEVMERIVQGSANKDVAADLGLSPKTVEVHRANVMRKTGSHSLAELVRLHVAVRR